MLLELRNIKKYFPVKGGIGRKTHGYVRAVDDIDLTISKGENLSLIGESGCGKTTLGRIILKLLPLDGGRIIFEGKDMTHLSSGRMRPYRKDLQMVFQDPYSSLDPRFNVCQIIAEAMTFEKKQTRAQQEQKISELLSAVKLPGDILNRFPHEFSGGERQRIAIARALAMNPKLLILDEAVSSLDILVQNQIINLLLDLQKKFDVTYLFISHNLRTVKKIGSRIAVMYRGKIVELAATRQIFENPLHPYTRQLLTAAIDYRLTTLPSEIVFPGSSQLVDCKEGHWVLGKG